MITYTGFFNKVHRVNS